MGIVSLILGLLGGACGVLGILTALEVMPRFIEAEASIGPIAATTGFFWGLAVMLLLGSIAAGVGRGQGSYE